MELQKILQHRSTASHLGTPGGLPEIRGSIGFNSVPCGPTVTLY